RRAVGRTVGGRRSTVGFLLERGLHVRRPDPNQRRVGRVLRHRLDRAVDGRLWAVRRRQLGVGGRLLRRAEDAHHRHVGNLLAAGGAGLLRGHDGRTSITDISRRAAIRYPQGMLVLSELKTQALRYVVLGDLPRAFRTYEAIVRAVPSDIDARMKVADLCVTA